MDQAVGLSMIGALLALDYAMLGQFMISQPIVTGAIFGMVFSDFQSGLLIGTMIQLLFIGILPVGAFIPSDHTVTGGMTACIALMLMQKLGLPLGQATMIGLALAIPAGFISGKLDILVRKINCKWNGIIDRNLNTRPMAILRAASIAGIGLTWIRSFIVYFVWIGGVTWLLTSWSIDIPDLVKTGLTIAFWLLPAIALAVMVDIVMKERLLRWTVGPMLAILPIAIMWQGSLFYLMGGVILIGLVMMLVKNTW